VTVKIIQGDARSTGLAARSVHMIATSPPYWGLRAYLKKDDPAKASEIGAESTPDAYVESMREVGRECYRVLRDDGVMWINLGDTYSNGGGAQSFRNQPNANRDGTADTKAQREPIHREGGLPSGNLVGIPWRVAFALQADGWILRAAIP
jgi:DNA modification methylase